MTDAPAGSRLPADPSGEHFLLSLPISFDNFYS